MTEYLQGSKYKYIVVRYQRSYSFNLVGWCYLEEAVDGLVTDSRFSLTLTNKILDVLLKALLAPQEAHGNIIICVTVIQLWVECPKNNNYEVINSLKTLL